MLLRSWLLSFFMALPVAGVANAQFPHMAVYGDTYNHSYRPRCGEPNTLSELVIILYNANSVVSAVDFAISYPPVMIWLYDRLGDVSYTGTDNTIVSLGNSPGGIAIAWHACCMPDGREGPIVLMRPVFLWGSCDCDVGGPYVVDLHGYAPLGKTQPSYISYPDFVEHTALGLDMIVCGAELPVESTTWGKVKSLYR